MKFIAHLHRTGSKWIILSNDHFSATPHPHNQFFMASLLLTSTAHKSHHEWSLISPLAFLFSLFNEKWKKKTNMKIIMHKLYQSFLPCLLRAVTNFKSQWRRKKKHLKCNTGCWQFCQTISLLRTFNKSCVRPLVLIRTRREKNLKITKLQHIFMNKLWIIKLQVFFVPCNAH